MIECPACSRPLPADSRECPHCGETTDSSIIPTRLLSSQPDKHSSASSIDSVQGARFAPGEMLAGRYRIVHLLGRGGMGEVYRAEDVKLKQLVALKFLPEKLAQDENWLERLYQEVSVARQVSHRNVCRVYDIGEAAGQHFISMEFVRGEELGSLLKRIGRLPEAKALETARQICAGLAAIHDKGIVHRDLKPSNIMLDERGDVRITDFGLATSPDDTRARDSISGTPAYMSPEQLSGRPLTEKSDIYSLGLVLFELFTGKRAFEASSLHELIRLRSGNSTPVTPSDFGRQLDPLIEQTILRCLEPDEARRPASALQVAAALPGGDPLAAALAMGETPSPEIVAAASKEGTLRPAVAVLSLATVLVLIATVVLLGEQIQLHRLIPLERSPEVLSSRGSDILRKLGYVERPLDSAYGFRRNIDYLRHVKETDHSSAGWEKLRGGQPAALFFFYRESPRYLVPQRQFNTTVNAGDPPMFASGMTQVFMDPEGRLLRFEAVPPQISEGSAVPGSPDWSMLFTEAGLDINAFHSVASKWIPPSAYDMRAAWEGSYPGRSDVPIRVEAAAFAGRPVYFQIVEPWTPAERMRISGAGGENSGVFIFMAFVLGALTVGGVLAWRNVRSGRGDRRGAFRLAAVMAGAMLFSWVLLASHVPTVNEFDLFSMIAMETALVAGLLWLFYMALEPFVRRWWPHRIISWSRLLAGGWRDPLVGRDILLGIMLGTGLITAQYLLSVVSRASGLPYDPVYANVDTFLGVRTALGDFIYDHFIWLIFFSLGFLFLFVILYMILRKEWLAIIVFWVLLTIAFSVTNPSYLPIGITVAALTIGMVVFVLTRLGLLALISMRVATEIAGDFPFATDLTVWYADVSIMGIAIIVALAAFGAYTSLAGQPILRSELLEEVRP